MYLYHTPEEGEIIHLSEFVGFFADIGGDFPRFGHTQTFDPLL